MKGIGSGWGVVAMGAALVLCGAYGMWSGWEQIVLERGWAQFIAGATAVSGGSVTIGLGRVIAALRDTREDVAPAAAEAPRAAANETPRAPSRPYEPVADEPTEVDRYLAGEATYVMFSDGSVEVRSGGSFERYPSLAALRAEAARRG